MHSIANAANSDWLRISVYVVAAGASAGVAVRTWLGGRTFDDRVIAIFWLITACLLTLLALARLINFGGVLADWGRSAFRTEGWYPDRRPVQRDAIAGLIVGALAVSACGAAILVARRWAAVLPPFLLIVALLTFVSVRAISLHDIDAVLYRRSLAHVQFGALVELLVTAMIGCVAVVAVAVPEFGRHAADRREAPPSD